MYHARIINRETGEAVDERDFAFGTFAEIGFWLDEYGFNTPTFELSVTFTV